MPGGSMEVRVAESRVELGELAARDVGAALRRGLREKALLRMILVGDSPGQLSREDAATVGHP
jgi:hypothetical protein